MPKRPITLTPDHDVLLTDEVAAARLGISIATIRRMRRDGELSYIRVRNSVRIPQSELTSYIEANRSSGTGA